MTDSQRRLDSAQQEKSVLTREIQDIKAEIRKQRIVSLEALKDDIRVLRMERTALRRVLYKGRQIQRFKDWLCRVLLFIEDVILARK